MKVSQLMTVGIETISIDASAADAARKMKSLNIGILPVVEDDVIVGVVTDRDLTIRILANATGARWTPVWEATTRKYVCIDETAEISEAISLMCQEGIARLIVQDEAGRPIGILSVSDIATQASSGDSADLNRALGAKYRERHAKSLEHMHRG